jgi:hypothetical protein
MSMQQGRNCQRYKNTPTNFDSPSIWGDISMDFIVGLPKLGNKSIIMVVIDCLSKYAHFCALQHPFIAAIVDQIFMDNIFKLHGMPNSIFFDRDPTFTSNFWQELFKLQGTQLHLNTTYHPHMDGQTKVVNKCLETYLRCFASKRKNWWAQWLPLVEWWYNTTYHTTTRMTTFSSNLWKKSPISSLLYDRVSKVQEVEKNLTVQGYSSFPQREFGHASKSHEATRRSRSF